MHEFSTDVNLGISGISADPRDPELQLPMGQFNGPGIDCTDIIEQVKMSAKEDVEKLQKQQTAINQQLETQKDQIQAIKTSVGALVSMFKAHTQNKAQTRPNVPDGTQPQESPQQQQRPANVPEGAQPQPQEIHSSRAQSLTPTPSEDDRVSITASNLFFRNNTYAASNGYLNEGNSRSSNGEPAKETTNGLLEDEQDFWQQSIEDYDNDTKANGAEITSTLASAAKIYWQKPLKEDIYRTRMETAKIPANCEFLIPKRTNTEIWGALSRYQRTMDVKLQEALSQHTASVTMMLRATAELSEAGIGQNKGTLGALKDALCLAGTLSQTINKIRRDMMKSSLPKGYEKLASQAEESSDLLFGQSIPERLKSLKEEKKLVQILDKKQPQTKRKYENMSSNDSPSLKTLRRDRSQHQGQRDRRPQDRYSPRYQNDQREQQRNHKKKDQEKSSRPKKNHKTG